MLLKTLLAKRIEPQGLITHRFKFDRILEAYETSGHAAHARPQRDHRGLGTCLRISLEVGIVACATISPEKDQGLIQIKAVYTAEA